jgi:enamine deaminase RidA (YjgF/YER057c/UK114 family)
MILVPDGDHRKAETREGIRWHPEDVRKVHYSPGVWGGDWLFLAGQISMTDYGDFDSIVRAPAGAPHTSSDIEVQTEFVITLLGEQLTGNGLELADVVDARIYLVDTARRDYRGFVRAWERLFESVESRPSMSLIPSTTADGGSGIMIPDLLVEIDLIARRGG